MLFFSCSYGVKQRKKDIVPHSYSAWVVKWRWHKNSLRKKKINEKIISQVCGADRQSIKMEKKNAKLKRIIAKTKHGKYSTSKTMRINFTFCYFVFVLSPIYLSGTHYVLVIQWLWQFIIVYYNLWRDTRCIQFNAKSGAAYVISFYYPMQNAYAL